MMNLNKAVIIFMMSVLYSCGIATEVAETVELNYEIESLNIIENGFDGNIVIKVFNQNMSPISDFQSIIISDGKEIFNVYQKSSQCTFFVDGRELTVRIEKDGYKTVMTKQFSTDENLENANLIKVTLEKL